MTLVLPSFRHSSVTTVSIASAVSLMKCNINPLTPCRSPRAAPAGRRVLTRTTPISARPAQSELADEVPPAFEPHRAKGGHLFRRANADIFVHAEHLHACGIFRGFAAEAIGL